jgi:hypothetical protein
VLFGAHHPSATLFNVSWNLSNSGIVILDDTVPVWRDSDRSLLLLVRRAPALRDLTGISSFHYLRLLADRYNGGDCSVDSTGMVQVDMRSQLDAASHRLLNIMEYQRSKFAPDQLDVLLQLSLIHWSKLLEQERIGQLECEHWRARWGHAQGEVDSRNKRIAELEAEVLQLKKRRALGGGMHPGGVSMHA